MTTKGGEKPLICGTLIITQMEMLVKLSVVFFAGMGLVWLYYKFRYIHARKEGEKLQKELDKLNKKNEK